MGTTKYFKDLAEISRKFTVIEHEFDAVIEKSLISFKERENSPESTVPSDSDLKYTREVMDRFDKNIQTLKTLKTELNTLRTDAGNRGTFFKQGNIKQKLDQILTVDKIDNLKSEMKKCTNALKKADARKDYAPLFEYLKEFERKAQVNEPKQRHQI